MTKLELIAALRGLADDMPIYLDLDGTGDLFQLEGIGTYESDGPDAPAFITLRGENY